MGRNGLFALIFAVLILIPLLSANAGPKATPTPQNAQDFLAQFNDVQIFDNAAQRGLAPARLVGVFDGRKTDGWSGFSGKTMLVNLWATWCAPCVTELPTLVALAEQRGGENFRIVTLSTDMGDDSGKIKQALVRAGFVDGSEHVRLDMGDMESLRSYIGLPLPVTFIVGPDGRVLYKLTGSVDWTSPGALAFIDDVLAGGNGG